MKDKEKTIIEIQSFIRNGNTKCNILTDCVLREIITKRDNEWKSAVEWLKGEQYKELCRMVKENEGNFEGVLELIDKAFEGGMKK